MAAATDLTRQTVEYLNALGHFAYRTNNGRIRGKYKISKDGSPDIHCITKPNGKFVAIEVKIGHDKQSEAQMLFQAEVEKTGGFYIIIKSFRDVENFFRHPGAPKG